LSFNRATLRRQGGCCGAAVVSICSCPSHRAIRDVSTTAMHFLQSGTDTAVICVVAWTRKSDDLHASPQELFATEQSHLRPLPLFVPEVYAPHHRLVDAEGYVNVHGHRDSVPWAGRDSSWTDWPLVRSAGPFASCE
jgi:hypothetical protein